MQIEIATSDDANISDEIFIFEIDEYEKLTGKKYRIEEEVECLQIIMDATTAKMMEIINNHKNC